MALEKALITNTVTGATHPGAVQSGGVHAQPRHQLRAGGDSRALGARSCSSSTATCRRWRWSCSSTPTRSTARAAAWSMRRAATCARWSRQVTDLMNIEPSTHAPPVLLFTWASLSFTCVLARATQRFMMFLPDGTPVRARLQVTFNEFRNVDLEAKEVKRETGRLLEAPRRERGRDAVDASPARNTATRACGA